MARKESLFVNDPPIELTLNNSSGSTGIVRKKQVFTFIPDNPQPTYSTVVNASTEE